MSSEAPGRFKELGYGRAGVLDYWIEIDCLKVCGSSISPVFHHAIQQRGKNTKIYRLKFNLFDCMLIS
jgi:hypothetical protein